MKIRRRSPNPAVDLNILRYQVALPDAEPRHILEEIVWHKEKEVDKMRERLPLVKLRQRVSNAATTRNFTQALLSGKTTPALIAEVKKASPSKGLLREDFEPVEIAKAYNLAGASAVSVLTDQKFFQGSWENLAKVRSAVELPVLCKDFIIYPYQIYLARSHGADAILLIAAILSTQDLQYFVKIAKGLSMTPLIEVHNLSELDRVLTLDEVNLVGINNRNLEDFSVDLQTTCQIMAARGKQLQERSITVVSESGLHTTADLEVVASAGAKAVLIGESLVKQPDPAAAITKLFPTRGTPS
ncbi:MAG: indole-3-glycerol phosphate synthase TrpC [Symploca sp. SIO3C6]|uniref:Indole-3-glycerol phosphate synthase n=1 Tax=Symploca sp. SIO1C4 TaxID=2607765 RepID=A0A6B3N4B9_9CYAN|nr:indole-3-glycerol phosphate synthase TrpC [Symploca sp. SIO3C6]NER28546.1 indole-3-glycerol phosphate synthase TrpC [Symploca sp. SIO1C4]NET03762.1 indole-3-glycerol phosphate synthase TrpC [Symploca sp. SIO2B6]